MGAPVLEPDRLARVLVADGPAQPPERWPDAAQIAVAGGLTARLGPAAAERLLTDALATEEGPAVLAELCTIYPGVADQLPARPASRLADLRDQCRSLLPIDPDPGAGRWRRMHRSPSSGPVAARLSAARRAPAVRATVPGGGPARTEVRDAPGVPVAVPAPRGRARTAPPAPPATTSSALRYPPGTAGLHGVEVGGGIRLVLPRTSDELAAWGRLLRNCIGSFGGAVAAGRSLLVGVEERGALAYCVELTPEGSVRQFLGERNRTVPRPVAAAVCGRLAEAGVLRADHRDNRVWLEA
jgi:hypothetical protein